MEKRGKFYGRIRKNGKDQYTEAHATEGEARQALDRLIAGHTDPRFLPTLETYWSSLLAEGGAFGDSKDRETCNLYDTMLAKHVHGTDLGRCRLDLIRRPLIQRHLDRKYPKLAESTVRRLGSCISVVLAQAVEEGLLHARMENGVAIPANPSEGIKYRKLRDVPAYIFSDDELMSLPADLYAWSPRLSAMVTVMADTGARPGEVCAMHVSDVRDGVWTIHRTMGKNGAEKSRTKTSRSRQIFLTSDALAAIADQNRRSGYVFQTDAGKPLTPDYLGTQLRRFRRSVQRRLDQEDRDAGHEPYRKAPPLTPRNLRKTFVTRGVEIGDVKSVQIAVGHTSAQTTLDEYAKGRREAQKGLIEKMESTVSGRFADLKGNDRGNKKENSSRREPA